MEIFCCVLSATFCAPHEMTLLIRKRDLGESDYEQNQASGDHSRNLKDADEKVLKTVEYYLSEENLTKDSSVWI